MPMFTKAIPRQPFIVFILLFFFSFSSKSQVTANFSASPTSGCSPQVINFTDLSTGNPIYWRWDLGNNTTSILQNPSATYFTPGQYTIKLVVEDGLGNKDSMIKIQYINIFPIPVVNFSATPLSGCVPLTVQFTDLSTAAGSSITEWLWDFGDGQTGTVKNPVHTYTSAGNYNVTLRVTTISGCSKTLTRSNYIHASNGVTTAFTNTAPTGCSLPVTIVFTNTSSGPGTLSYFWDFGDGFNSTLQNPSHTYNTQGSFTVSLRVTSSTGCVTTLVKPNAVLINFLHAGFTSMPGSCVNDPLTFTNTSTPAPSSVYWDFGDGTNSTTLSPVKTYTATGTYTVKMVARLGACADSTITTINVYPKPTAGFSAVNRNACKPPLTVNFTNTSTAPATYFWDFGDGNTSTFQNPTHIYTTYGSFTVKLVVTNFVGCSDSLVFTDYVKILAPEASINNLPQSNCAPLTWTFGATVNSPDPVVGYLWDLGDGTTSTLPNPTNTYPTGSYDIKLIVTTAGGCTDTVLVVAGIVADEKPVASFDANPRNVCAKDDVHFFDHSTGHITRWLWTFGDGGSSTQQNPSHHYEDTGYFTIRLVVWNNNCADTLILVDYVHIDPPIATFAYAFDCGAPKTIRFTDHSIGPDEWHWDFGDGTISTSQHNVRTYADTGRYTIQLVVVNHRTGCDDTYTQSIYIVDEDADFEATDTVICRNTSTIFNAIGNAPGTIRNYQWDFGDSQTGTGASIAHTYVNAGLYTVRLVITDVNGCQDTLVKLQYIRINGPVAAFSIPNGGSCSNSSFTFTDNSTGDGIHPITTWVWDFGDGTIQSYTAPPFTHLYNTAGTYHVTLKTIDAVGCSDTTTTAQTIIISHPIAAFAQSDTIVCPLTDITFTNASTGPALGYLWDFGDGFTDTIANPAHNYALEGNYTVKLFITDRYGCRDSVNQVIHVASPHAGFTVSDTVSTCPPLIAQFTNTSINGSDATWDFGDGSTSSSADPVHIYNTPGTYFAKLFVNGPGNNCIDSVVQKIVVRGPFGTFSYAPLSGCSPLTVNFTAISPDHPAYVWDFNNGSTVNTPDSTISFTYNIPGSYLPKMILIDAGGCQVPVEGIDTIHVYGVKTNFGFDGLTRCDLGTIQFSDSSIINDISSTYAWDFGDGGTSALQSPSHFYAAPGQYFPRLIVVTNRGCRDTTTLPLPVKIVASPQADFTNAISACTPVNAGFSAFLSVADTSAINWSWNLGNGNTSTLQTTPAQTYTTAQVYNVELIATNSSGCKDTVSKSFEVYAIPVVDAGPNVQICRGTPAQLNPNGAATYEWTPSNGLSCTNCTSPMASPNFNQKYLVTGSSVHGCKNMDSLNVTVIQPFVMDNKKDDTICVGSSVRLFASGANTYEWSPSAGLNNITSALPMATPRTTTRYRVIGSDAYGCFKDTGYTTIKVYPIPQVDAGKDITMKNGAPPLTITPTISPDVTNTYWLTAPGILYSNAPSVTIQPKATTEYTVEVRNPGGCRSTDKVMVYVLCDGANIFIPNTFSPNGSGQNDIFFPRGSGIFTIKLLRIFNRWGEVVFEKVNFSPNDAGAGWDGTYKGKKVNSDVFVYTAEVLCENNTSIILNGNVALLR